MNSANTLLQHSGRFQVMSTMRDELDDLKREVRLRQGSEEQMKQVLAEYEKTISELIAEKEKDQQKFNEEKARIIAERDQVRQDDDAFAN